MSKRYPTTTGAGSVPVICIYETDHYGLEMTDVLMDGVSLAGVLTDAQWNELEMEVEHAYTTADMD